MLITQLHLRPTEVREAAAPPPNYKFRTQMRLINKYETSMGANDTIAGSRKGVGVPQRLRKKSIFKWAQKKGVEVPRGSRRKNPSVTHSKSLDSWAGSLNLNKLHTFDFFSSTNIQLLAQSRLSTPTFFFLGLTYEPAIFQGQLYELHKVKQ